MAFSRNELDHFAAKERDRFEDMLKDFVEVPSVSADPAHKPDVERCAELGAATLRAMGGRAEIHRAPGGNPVVLGSFDAGPGRPTITVYNHLDVQPASKETEPWRTEPFRFTKQGDTYFGRGTTDDKGPAHTALIGARAAMEAGVALNIKFLWETEEEMLTDDGRPMLTDFGLPARVGDESTASGASPFTSSPQQLAGSAPQVTDDIYSFGAMAYELLSGYPPFYPDADSALAATAPPALPVIRGAMPPQLDGLVRRCLARQPQQRPQSAAELRDLLQAMTEAGPEPVAVGEEVLDPLSAHPTRRRLRSSRNGASRRQAVRLPASCVRRVSGAAFLRPHSRSFCWPRAWSSSRCRGPGPRSSPP